MHVPELLFITASLYACVQGQFGRLSGGYQGRAGNYQGSMQNLRTGGGYQGGLGTGRRFRRTVVGDTRQIIKVTDAVYVATGGQSLGNAIMVIAPDGLIIVDTADSHESASLMLEDFRNITSAPVKAIIYTHHHMDHVGGATAFVENSTAPPDIWAYKGLPKALEEYFTYASAARFTRTMRQFGVFLNGSQNSVDFGKDGATFGFLYPNKLLNDEEMDVVIAGLKLRLVRIQGETTDHMGVYIPEWNMFMCGDIYYEAFPNIYTIRGAKVRDAKEWYRSLDYMINLNLTYLVPSHLSPIIGRQVILDTLTPHRDGIQYIHDQALRYINKGLSPNEVASKVKLPSSLANVPSLLEEYGMVEWSVKGVFQMYLGWFSGDPMDLFPLTVNEKAKHMADLAGGVTNLVTSARTALEQGNPQWALELASYAIAVNDTDETAKTVKVDSLNTLADKQINTNAMNYLRTSALETTGELDFSGMTVVTPEHINTFDIGHFFDMLPSAFMPEVCENETFTIVFNFTDTGRTISLQNRNSVLIVRKDKVPESYTRKVDITEERFKNFVTDRITRRKKTKVLFGSHGFRILQKCFEFGHM